MKSRRHERRVHTCFITKNREYHVRAGVVMAVRDRKSSVWMSNHDSVGMRLKPMPHGVPYMGKSLEFYCIVRKEILQTSPVVDILRPNRTEVNSYNYAQGFFPADDLTG